MTATANKQLNMDYTILNTVYSMSLLALIAISGCHTVSRNLSTSTINYEITGTGPPVVLVHGFTQTLAAWQTIPVYDDLKADHQLISVDLRGHGDSPKPHDPHRYGRFMAQDLIQVLDELGIEQAHFIGFSMGASVIGELLVSHPERVTTATLASGFFTHWDESEDEFAEFVIERGARDERFPWEPANQDFMALAAVIRGARYAEVSEEQISTITTPSLICYGSLELEDMSPMQRARLRSLPQSIQLLTIEGADHDSEHAAVLRQEFTLAARELIESNSPR